MLQSSEEGLEKGGRVVQADAVMGAPAASPAAVAAVTALGGSELRRWESLCRAGEGAEPHPWPVAESRDLMDAVLASVIDGDVAMLEPAARAWAQVTSPMPVMVRRLACLRELFAEAGVLSNGAAAGHLQRVIDKVTTLSTETALAELQDAALTDSLTGAGNRRALEAAGKAALASAGRTGAPMSLVVMDLDGLKSLNDTQGHAAGDRALAALSNGLREALRDTDQLFRIGGDEFVALLPLAAATAVAELMQRAQRAGAPSFSWGVASAPDDGTDLGTLLHTADSRLYAARRSAGYYGGGRAPTAPTVRSPAPEATGARPARRRFRSLAVVAAAAVPVAVVVALALALPSGHSGNSGQLPPAPGTATSGPPGTSRPGAQPPQGGAGGAPSGTSGTGGAPGAATGGPGGSPTGGSSGTSVPTTTAPPSTTTTTTSLIPGVTVPIGAGSAGLPPPTIP